jgi:hypothetical protein
MEIPMDTAVKETPGTATSTDRGDMERLLGKIHTLQAADRQVIEDLFDRVDGLESDLSDAVDVAVSRGAVDWARLNYPKHPSLLKNSPQMTAFAASGISALKSVMADHLMAVSAVERFMNFGTDPSGAFTEMSDAEVEVFHYFHKRSADQMEEMIASFEPETRAIIEGRMMEAMRKVALAERASCERAVGCAWAPVTGTPYITGPRAFCDAIDKMDPVEITSMPKELEVF